jgi:hypothetical protein
MKSTGLKNATFWAPQGLVRELVLTIEEQIMPLVASAPAAV